MPGTHNKNCQIKFKISMLKSSLCNYSDAFILFKGKITIAAAEADVDGRQVNERNKVATYKKYEPFTNCISSKKKYSSKQCKIS